MVEGGGDQAVGLGRVADIGRDGQGAAAQGNNFGGRGFNGAGTAAGNDQIRAGPGQMARHFQAQAGTAAGDDDDPPL